MAPLTVNKNRKSKFKRETQDYPVAAATTILQGSIIVMSATGFAIAGADTAGLSEAVGVAEQNIDNSGGADGDKSVRVAKGVFKFTVGGTLVQADVGRDGFIEDDDTVDDVTVNSIACGKIRELDTDGVWVECGLRG